LFKQFGAEYQSVARSIRGPGIAVDLPPLTTIVLARANSRNKIPETIRDFREEYAAARVQLWKILRGMWAAPSFGDQIKILRWNKQALPSFPQHSRRNSMCFR